jgi:hypothetical protein
VSGKEKGEEKRKGEKKRKKGRMKENRKKEKELIIYFLEIMIHNLY